MRSKKAIINIISSVILQIVTIICGLIVPRLIIGTFGSDVNGLILSITQFLAYITLLEAGIGPVIKSVLYKPIANKSQEEIVKILKSAQSFFRKIAYIFIIYIIVLCIFFPLKMENEFNSFFTLSLVIIISISTFAEYFFGMTYRLYLQAEQKAYIYSVIQIVTYILNTIAIVILINLKCNIQLVKLVSAMIFVLRPILQNVYVKKKYNINLKYVTEKYELKQKWDGLAQHIAAVVHGNTDIVILTICNNIKEVSVYSVYALVIDGIKRLIQSFTGGIDASFGDMIAKNEKNNLRKSFKIYELFYYTIASICFSCTLLLITPFVKTYTLGISDANYIRPAFAIIIVLAEFMWSIRLPYSSITLAAGHFKQTMKGAWVEAISNIVISIVLVFKFGIIGVAIGTLFAMTIRTIEFVIHSSKHILERSVWISFIRFGIIALQVIIICIISKFLPQFTDISYVGWVKYASIVFAIAVIIIVPINLIIYRKDAKELFKIGKNIFKKKVKE